MEKYQQYKLYAMKRIIYMDIAKGVVVFFAVVASVYILRKIALFRFIYNIEKSYDTVT